MSPYGVFRVVRNLIVFGVFCIAGLIYLIVFIVGETGTERKFQNQYGGNWQVEYEKYYGPLSLAHDKLVVAVLALLAIPAILTWFFLTSKGGRKSRRSRRSPHGKSSPKKTIPLQNCAPTVLPPIRVKEKPQPDWRKMPTFKKGDSIGLRFGIYDILGRGGFGVVFLVFDQELGKLCALKTFRDELLVHAAIREAFRREASRWVELGEHPYILSARSVVEVSHRLFVSMDYVAPDDDGRVTLAHYLRGKNKKAIPLEKQLEWGIQFCLGMEHAHKQGIACHRDIKPDNILIAGETLKISDFGLAVASEAAAIPDSESQNVNAPPAPEDEYIGLSLIKADDRNFCGTPGYIPPEIYRGEIADARSDIYTFGLVLWQMAAQSPIPPFMGHFLKGDFNAFLRAIYETQMAGQVPPVEGPMQSVISKCLHRDRKQRYASFAELRDDLEVLLWQETGKSVSVPREDQKTADACYHRGVSMKTFGRYDEALAAFQEAVKLAPDDVKSLMGMAGVLGYLGRYIQSLECYDRVIALRPNDWVPWNDKGVIFRKQDRPAQALECFEQAVKLSRQITAVLNAGLTHIKLKQYTEAIRCFDRIIAANPDHGTAWAEKGLCLHRTRQFQQALHCLERAVLIDPRVSLRWYNKGVVENALRQPQAAASSLRKFLELAGPEDGRFVREAQIQLQKIKQKSLASL